ncbi:MAG: histidinol-phosphatase [Chitinophagaceae bacterium]
MKQTKAATNGRKRVLFIDRDGTLIKEYPPTFQIDSFDKLIFYPYVFKYMTRIAEELNFELVMVSNQDGLGTGKFSDEQFWPVHNLILSTFANEGVVFSSVLIDTSYPEDNSSNRKPGIGMFTDYLNASEYDMQNSFVIGDRITDVQLAKNLGCKAIWLKNNFDLGTKEITDSVKDLQKIVVLETTKWEDIYDFLKGLLKNLRLN